MPKSPKRLPGPRSPDRSGSARGKGTHHLRKQHSLLRSVCPPRDNEETGGPDGGCARVTAYALVGTDTGRRKLTGVNLSSLPKHQRKRRYLISEERILDISNGISEGMCNANRKELAEVVKYFRDLFDQERKLNLYLTRDAGMMLANTGLGLINLADVMKRPTG